MQSVNEQNTSPNLNGQSEVASSCELFNIFKALANSSTHDEQGSLGHDYIETESTHDDPSSDVHVQKITLDQQMQSALDNAERSDLLGSRLAALALSQSAESPSPTDRPALPRLTSALSAEAVLDQPVIESPQSMSNHPSGMEDDSSYHESPSNDEKIAAIIEEFGDIANLMEPRNGSDVEPERMLAESKGSLFKGIMLIGNLHLTTHRLLFHANLPPESVLVGSRNGPNAAIPDILMAGPVSWHGHGPLKSSRRIWMEVGTEMITTYPSGDDVGRTRPIQSILLTSVRQLRPFDPESPRNLTIVIEQDNVEQLRSFHVDTEQSALQWRRSLETALYRHARRRFQDNVAHSAPISGNTEGFGPDEWTTMRCSVPLDRVHVTGISHFHNFALLVGLDVSLDGKYNGSQQDHQSGYQSAEEQVDSASSMDREVKSSSRPSLRLLHPRANSGTSKASPIRTSSPTGNETPLRSPVKTGISSSRQETRYVDAELPHRLAQIANVNMSTQAPLSASSIYPLNVAVLDEQAWFAEALEAAVEAAAERRYKPGVALPRMTLEIGGFDCLATDEELDMHAPGAADSSDTQQEEHEHDDGEEREKGTAFIRTLRKTEKAALAAKVFGLENASEVYLKRCYFIHGVVPVRGHIVLDEKFICFWRRAAVGGDIKYRFSCADVKGAVKAQSPRKGFHGMALQIHGQHDVKFEFWLKASRKDIMGRINDIITRHSASSGATTPANDSVQSLHVSTPTREPSQSHPADILVPAKNMNFRSLALPDEAHNYLPFVANKAYDTTSRLTPRHFVCLTIGSRGDIQPYIALALRLKQDQHRVTIVTHSEFRDWIESYGIEHRQAGGDPTALMKLSTDHKMFSPGFFKESLGGFRGWLDDLLLDSWRACQDAAVLIESPSTMSGIHIAEALKIPYFRAFTVSIEPSCEIFIPSCPCPLPWTMPWTRTTAYPQAFMVPAFEMGPSFNYSTYVLFDSIMWRATAGQINRWRKNHLHIPATDMSTLSVSKVPFLYNFSPSVVPKALDWDDSTVITGYWNLENSDAEWTPPQALDDFMKSARDDGKPLVYIGFGSIVVPNPNEMTRNIIAAVTKADVRAIIAKGWSSRGADPAQEGRQIEYPSNCYGLDKVPHGWLFPKIDAALHHGGAGTVGASLRAGIPTLIKPWFGDQFFWAIRVTKLEVGLRVSSTKVDDIAHALTKATTDKVMIEKAQRIGVRIRSENGVENALQAIHRNIIRAGADRSKID